MSMTRRRFTEQIAFEYATFDAQITRDHGADQKRQPLDRQFAFSVGRGYIESRAYVPRKDYRYLDWAVIAREARKHLPRMRQLIAKP